MGVRNQCSFIGNIGRVETKYTASGTPVTSLSVAVNEREKVNGEWTDVTTWFACTLWQHENLLNYLEPGKQVACTARYKVREYEHNGEKRKSHEFVITDIALLGGKKDGGSRESGSEPVSMPRSARGGGAGSKPPAPQNDGWGVDQDDVPFILPAHEGLMP